MKTLVFLSVALLMVEIRGQPLLVNMMGSKTVIVDKEATLNFLNQERKEYAKKNKISNMHKLIWDENLAVRAQTQDFANDKKTMRTGRIDGNEWTERQAKKFREQFGSHPEILIQSLDRWRILGMEELVPHQKRVGCAPNFYVNSQRATTHTLCVFEPEATGNSFSVPKGDPGSKCTQGYTNQDGLCALPAPEKPATPGKPEKLVAATEETISDSVNFKKPIYLISMIILVNWVW
ncbi:hypothetical protein B9Z55_012081 [Caenorhabditis nigoni]|uniref:SCP domain-containing protein n=1 Tax=Caenorhabditis nigoni TaxID=1611254 RepID=A0A2G5TVP5_9PELO|nr:hypothetical protein B9Z55_012081 [Caenorhabditis nigoni]